MEIIGKLIKIREQYFITIPALIHQEWRKFLMEEVHIVTVQYDEKSNELTVYPYQLNKQGEVRKVIKRGNTWIITVPYSVGQKWYEDGVVFVRKLFFNKEMKLVVKPLEGEGEEVVNNGV
ncbi:MAG: hypothetical protein NDF52_01855 [archaeon YNP-WB-062]|jgi:hypothetical protein|nr:hypothetical protein [Candidatus Culexarchaeum yellowstonense]